MTRKLEVAVVLGSTRENRFCGKVADWVVRGASADERFALDLIDPLQLNLPCHLEAEEGLAVQGLSAQVAAADGFIIVTPEYNHGYTASLKNLIDSAYEEWNAKPVGFVSYGGLSGGLRAVEQLRQVFAELHAVTMRDGVPISNPWDELDEKGEIAPSELRQRALKSMLDQLAWWGSALAEARRAAPYKQRAA